MRDFFRPVFLIAGPIAALVAVALALGGCAGTQAERQVSADQKFGQAKIYLALGTAGVAGYNLLCNDALATSSICAKPISDLLNLAMEGASDAILASEKVFAAANTEGEKLNAANAALAAVTELTKVVDKYAKHLRTARG